MGMYDKKYLDELREALEKWERKHQDDFKTESGTFVTNSGIPIKRLYTPLDLAEKGFDYLNELGFPGEYPYTRGNTPTMYRTKLWKPTAYTGYADPEESNELWKAQVEAGAGMVSMAYDLPCQLGLDPDNPKAEGEVARVGNSLVSVKDWEIAFDGIDFRKVGVYQVLNAPAIVGFTNHIVLAEKRGINVSEVIGMQQNDVLKEYMARGNYIFPPAQSIRLTGDILSYVGEYMPNYQAITVCGYHQAEKGANSIHEAAFALSDAFAYLQAAVDRGVDIDRVAPGVMFLTWADQILFESVAKLRAMRRIYAKVLRDQFKAKKPESVQFRMDVGTSGTALTKEQYLNNIGRLTLADLAGALSGCEIIDSRTYDEGFGIPSMEAGVNAIRLQNVVAYETGVGDTVDPMAGSYYVETLTSEIEERVWKELEEIDRRGGIVRCIETGYAQRVIAEDGYKLQKRFESGERKRVGINIFRSAEDEEEKTPMRIYRANPALGEKRKQAIIELKKKRDNTKVKKSLDEMKAIARLEPTAENNLIPPVIDAMRAYATLGEVCDALREVWGEYREPSIF